MLEEQQYQCENEHNRPGSHFNPSRRLSASITVTLSNIQIVGMPRAIELKTSPSICRLILKSARFTRANKSSLLYYLLCSWRRCFVPFSTVLRLSKRNMTQSEVEIESPISKLIAVRSNANQLSDGRNLSNDFLKKLFF